MFERRYFHEVTFDLEEIIVAANTITSSYRLNPVPPAARKFLTDRWPTVLSSKPIPH